MKKIFIKICLIMIAILLILYFFIENKFLNILEIESYAIENISDNLVFNEDITYEWNYYADGKIMPYGVLTPSNANKYEKIPMILWLHGIQTGTGEQLYNNGLPYLVKERWSEKKELQPFCAYILCPHISYPNSDVMWRSDMYVPKIKELIETFVKENNVDRNNIVIAGFSGGTFGVQVYASDWAGGFPEYFSKAVILSGYYKYYGPISMPRKAFAGVSDVNVVKQYLSDSFSATWGKENCYYAEGRHDLNAMLSDRGYFTGVDGKNYDCGIGNNKRSDIIEWMFEDVELQKKHRFSTEWTTDVEPTCLNEGSKSKHCLENGCTVKSEIIYMSALGHNVVVDQKVEPTCTKKGKTEGKHCSRCGEIIVAQKEIDVLGHNYVDNICTICNDKLPDIEVTSEKYRIDNMYISNIKPDTKVSELKSNIHTDANDIKIYSNDNKLISDTDILATSMKIEFEAVNKRKTLIVVVKGDVDGDGQVKFTDMIKINRARLHKETFSFNYQEKAADLNENGEIDFTDLISANRIRLKK